MARITGTLSFDFETDKPITEEQFKNFNHRIKTIINYWQIMVWDAADLNGFQADSINPISLDELECDFENEE